MLLPAAFAKLRLPAVFGRALGRRVGAFLEQDEAAQQVSAKHEADNPVAGLMISIGHGVKRDCPRRGLFGHLPKRACPRYRRNEVQASATACEGKAGIVELSSESWGGRLTVIRGDDFEANSMSDDNLIPISDEQAKLGQQILRIGRDFGGYLADILSELPKDLVGLLAGNRVKVARAERLATLWAKAQKRLQDRGIAEPEPPSLKLALPILEAAADENNQELQDLWASLLAATMDPKRRDLVRQSFIQIVKQMDPFDVLVFNIIANNHTHGLATSYNVVITSLQGDPPQDLMNDVRVSYEALAKLDCICFSTGPRTIPYLTPFGILLMRAVSG